MKIDKLGNVADVVNGFAFAEDLQGNKTAHIPFIKVSDFVFVSDRYIEKSINYVDEEILKKLRAKVYPKGTVIFPKVGGALLTNKRAILGCEATFDNNIMGLVPKSVNPDLLYYFMRSFDMAKIANTTSMPSVRASDVAEIEIVLPSTEAEEKLITSKLISLFVETEKAKEATKIINQDIKRLKHLALHDFLSTFNDTEKFKLGVKAVTTSGSTPSRGQKDYWQPAEIPWIKTGEIDFVPITNAKEYISAKALKECSLKLLPENTVLIAMYGQGKTRGQSAILKVPATINQACFAILPNETWEPEFLQLWLMYSYQDLRSMSENRGGNQANLNGDLLNSFEIPAPPPEVQREVVEKINAALEELETMRASWQKTAEEINGLPNRLLAQAFNEIENG
jgi:type I restriction enzyme S subunit